MIEVTLNISKGQVTFTTADKEGTIFTLSVLFLQGN